MCSWKPKAVGQLKMVGWSPLELHNADATYLLIPRMKPSENERIALKLRNTEQSYSPSSFLSFKLISTHISTEVSSEMLPLEKIKSPAFLSTVGIPLSISTSFSERLSRNAR